MEKNSEFYPKAYLLTRSLIPENQEMPIYFVRKWVTPRKYFYSRNHFPYPLLSKEAYRLEIGGLVDQPFIFSYEKLKTMPYSEMLVTLECSGNKRSKFIPKVFGEQWEDGAINQGLWKGVPLSYLLNITGINPLAKEIVFEGFDNGVRTDTDQLHYYRRSLPIDVAMNSPVLVAYEYNREPIPYKHGFPLRLIVHGWYGMASVKWLKRITVIDHEFKGPFQAIDYVYYPEKESDVGYPVTEINVNSTIQYPLDLMILNAGIHQIEGIAYTGKGNITKVSISTDSGETWKVATLQTNPDEPYSWTAWTYQWDVKVKGEYTILCRAEDSHGRAQPSEPFWNKKGYGYNAVSKVKVKVE